MYLAIAILAAIMPPIPTNPEFFSLSSYMEFRYTGGRYKDQVFPYRLFDPRTDKSFAKYPLIVWLHGLGEAGNDNISHLRHIDTVVLPPPWKPGRFPFFLLALQCPKDNSFWFQDKTTADDDMISVLISLLDETLDNYPIDRNRIYLAGISIGGAGCWRLASLRPDYFAAVAPISSGGFKATPEQIASLKRLPIWMFTCTRDPVCPIDLVHSTVKTLSDAGVRVHLTELDSADHDSWTAAFNEYDLRDWLLAQRRDGWFAPPPGRLFWDRQLVNFKRDYPKSSLATFVRSWRWFHLAILGYLSLTVVAIGLKVLRRRRKRVRARTSPMVLENQP